MGPLVCRSLLRQQLGASCRTHLFIAEASSAFLPKTETLLCRAQYSCVALLLCSPVQTNEEKSLGEMNKYKLLYVFG